MKVLYCYETVGQLHENVSYNSAQKKHCTIAITKPEVFRNTFQDILRPKVRLSKLNCESQTTLWKVEKDSGYVC